jgi:2-oxoglutarate dehydrogenase E2 component (dihydrolipoamide succinyltransferase)
MSEFKILMPKLGESITEATITKWFVKEGDKVADDDVLLEIATDKVDSEIPSPVSGKVKSILFSENERIAVGTVIAVILLEGSEDEPELETKPAENQKPQTENKPEAAQGKSKPVSSRFYSPLVKSIASSENVSFEELETIEGTGEDGRVSKNDILAFIQNRTKKVAPVLPVPEKKPQADSTVIGTIKEHKPAPVILGDGDEVVEMDRVRRMIADHMVMSKHVAPHVTTMVEADVTNIVLWREKIKDVFAQKEKEKITYLPIFLESIARALKEFPGVNASVDGYNIVLRKHINLGIAVALPTGNLIVPVIKDADQRNLLGLTKETNRLANQARDGKLNPDDIQGGTFTITNFGSFKNLMGTPVINQPQVAILAIGAIQKKPAVIETPSGDFIGIRHKMYLSLSYDHRVVDGAMGGAFLRRIADYIEQWDLNSSI